jgi:hypothetical protein
MSSPGSFGNIEAGVFLDISSEKLTENELFVKFGIGWDDLNTDLIPNNKENGDETNEPGDQVANVPPVLFCQWDTRGKCLILNWDDPMMPSQKNNKWIDINIVDKKIAPGDKSIKLESNPDISIHLTAVKSTTNEKASWHIPVFNNNEQGFYVSPQRPMKAHELLDAILGYPDVAYADDDEMDPSGASDPAVDDTPSTDPPKVKPDRTILNEERQRLSDFPLHLATSIVEAIAQKNQHIDHGQMPDWVAHLRSTLLNGTNEDLTEKLNSLKIDFLEPLHSVEGFAPKEPTKEYYAFLQDLRKKWINADAIKLMSN